MAAGSLPGLGFTVLEEVEHRSQRGSSSNIKGGFEAMAEGEQGHCAQQATTQGCALFAAEPFTDTAPKLPLT